MARLTVPSTSASTDDFETVQAFLHERGILHERWPCASVARDASEADVIAPHRARLDALMAARGYRAMDVVSVLPETSDAAALREKFLAEHVHSEDEVRLFVEGSGVFWFHLDSEPGVFALSCGPGDLISVPAGTRHWFDFGERPLVRAVRLFTDPAGWVAQYTRSGVERRYSA